MRPTAQQVFARAAAGQSGADKHENAGHKTGYKTQRYGGVMISPPPGAGGSNVPRPQDHRGNKTAEDDPDAEPRSVAELCALGIADERVVIGVCGCEALECFCIDGDKFIRDIKLHSQACGQNLHKPEQNARGPPRQRRPLDAEVIHDRFSFTSDCKTRDLSRTVTCAPAEQTSFCGSTQ